MRLGLRSSADWRSGPTLTTTMMMVGGFSAAAGRAIRGSTGDATVLISLGLVLVTLAWASTRLIAGDAKQRLPVLIGSIVLPLMLSAASLVAYPGQHSLSSADIQFLRAIEHLLADRALEEEARLTLYPTSFAGLAAVARLTGLSATELLNWSWLLSMPVIVVGVGLFAGGLAKSGIVGILAMVVLLTDPWHIVLPVYDGFNLVLLPFWAYQLLLVLRHHSPGHVVALALLTAVIVTGHLFTSLFAVVVALALMLSLELVEKRATRSLTERLSGAVDTAVRTMAIPVIAIAAWLVYVAGRYLRDGAALVLAFVAAFGRTGSSPGVVGLSLLGQHQIVLLVIALMVDAMAATAGLIWGLRSRSPRVLSALVVALTALPLVAWAIVTPPEFSYGTDLKEWKVRPLFGAFLLVAPLLALGLWALGRRLPRPVSGAAIGLGIVILLANAQTLSLTYGTLGIRTYSSSQQATVVEDPALPPGQYAALGAYVRRILPSDVQLVANWRQSSWMTGVGGLQTIPHYLSDALSDLTVLRSQLSLGEVRGIAVDRRLLELPSVYTGKRAAAGVVLAVDGEVLNRVFDSGDQVLYLKYPPSDR